MPLQRVADMALALLAATAIAGPSTEERLAVFEARLAQLERENGALKLQLAKTAGGRSRRSAAGISTWGPSKNMSVSSTALGVAGPLVVLGIISAPKYLERRLGIRHSWLQWANVKSGHIGASFVVRSGNSPQWLDQLLDAEQERYNDVVRAPTVAWNETRLRGPVLSLAVWLQYAVVHHSSARFIGKMDDDAFLHAGDFERLLRTVAASPLSTYMYMGAMSWFHWQPGIFEFSGHGFSYGQALWTTSGTNCRNATRARARCGGDARCAECVGPFQFASGYLIVLSRPAAAWLTRDAGTLRADVARLLQFRADGSNLVSRSGGPRDYGDMVMEDVWLGSVLFRDPPPQPLSFVTLFGGLGLISDEWGLRTTRQALLTHVKAKSLPSLLALYAYTRQHHCPAPISLFTCNKGCAFGAGAAQPLLHVRRTGTSLDENLPPCRNALSGAQAEARNCHFGEPAGIVTPGLATCCLGKACVDVVNLRARGRTARERLAGAEERQILDTSSGLLRLLPSKTAHNRA